MKNKLILGTVQFGKEYGINNLNGMPSFEQVQEILEYAYEKGIDTLDTAEAYGVSQDRIGKFHENSDKKFNIITKYSPQDNLLSKNIFERVVENITKMKVDYLYSYMFHSFKDYKLYFNEFKEDLLKLRKLKKIKKIGVSLHSNDDILQVIKNKEIELIQLPFNLLDNSYQRKDILKICKKNGLEIHTRSSFLQGLFFKEIENLSGNLIYLKNDLQKIKQIISYDKNINEVALKYVYEKEFIDNIIIGVDSIEQLKSNISIVDYQLSPKIKSMIDKITVKNEFYLNPSNW